MCQMISPTAAQWCLVQGLVRGCARNLRAMVAEEDLFVLRSKCMLHAGIEGPLAWRRRPESNHD